MTNLRDFIKQKQSPNTSKTDETNFDNLVKDNPEKIENIQENLKKYQNMSQSDLMSELIKEASRMKQNGSLNSDSLNVLKNTLAPMLNEQQKSLLNNILNQIK